MCASRKADLSLSRFVKNSLRDNIKGTENLPGVRVGGNTLKKRKRITHPVTLVGSQHLQFGYW